MVGFHRIAKFPGVTGCIDCTHICIKAPGGPNGEVYRNRNGYFSINVQKYAEGVPEGNSHWEVYLAYRHIADIILAEKIPKSSVPYLHVKVEEFLELYTVQYPNAAVTPKLHFLLHYPKYILKYGPPRRYWGMRFEAKHSYFKSIASKTKNFKNICLNTCNTSPASSCI
ncbi:hypothetical protein MTO96_052092 [Rhipicephalus appendiculatus]